MTRNGVVVAVAVLATTAGVASLAAGAEAAAPRRDPTTPIPAHGSIQFTVEAKGTFRDRGGPEATTEVTYSRQTRLTIAGTQRPDQVGHEAVLYGYETVDVRMTQVFDDGGGVRCETVALAHLRRRSWPRPHSYDYDSLGYLFRGGGWPHLRTSRKYEEYGPLPGLRFPAYKLLFRQESGYRPVGRLTETCVAGGRKHRSGGAWMDLLATPLRDARLLYEARVERGRPRRFAGTRSATLRMYVNLPHFYDKRVMPMNFAARWDFTTGE